MCDFFFLLFLSLLNAFARSHAQLTQLSMENFSHIPDLPIPYTGPPIMKKEPKDSYVVKQRAKTAEPGAFGSPYGAGMAHALGASWGGTFASAYALAPQMDGVPQAEQEQHMQQFAPVMSQLVAQSQPIAFDVQYHDSLATLQQLSLHGPSKTPTPLATTLTPLSFPSDPSQTLPGQSPETFATPSQSLPSVFDAPIDSSPTQHLPATAHATLPFPPSLPFVGFGSEQFPLMSFPAQGDLADVNFGFESSGLAPTPVASKRSQVLPEVDAFNPGIFGVKFDSPDDPTGNAWQHSTPSFSTSMLGSFSSPQQLGFGASFSNPAPSKSAKSPATKGRPKGAAKVKMNSNSPSFNTTVNMNATTLSASDPTPNLDDPASFDFSFDFALPTTNVSADSLKPKAPTPVFMISDEPDYHGPGFASYSPEDPPYFDDVYSPIQGVDDYLYSKQTDEIILKGGATRNNNSNNNSGVDLSSSNEPDGVAVNPNGPVFSTRLLPRLMSAFTQLKVLNLSHCNFKV
jgi:hypothetical protein